MVTHRKAPGAGTLSVCRQQSLLSAEQAPPPGRISAHSLLRGEGGGGGREGGRRGEREGDERRGEGGGGGGGRREREGRCTGD